MHSPWLDEDADRFYEVCKLQFQCLICAIFLLIIGKETHFRTQSISTFVRYMSENPYHWDQTMLYCKIWNNHARLKMALSLLSGIHDRKCYADWWERIITNSDGHLWLLHMMQTENQAWNKTKNVLVAKQFLIQPTTFQLKYMSIRETGENPCFIL